MIVTETVKLCKVNSLNYKKILKLLINLFKCDIIATYMILVSSTSSQGICDCNFINVNG